MSPANSLYSLSNTPAAQPPPGVEPNFVISANNKQPLIVVASLFLVLTIIFAMNRAYVKTFLIRKYSWDDLSLLIGLVGTVSYSAASFWGTQKGKIGVHQWNISIIDNTSPDLLIPTYLVSVLWPPTFLFIKVSFFIMYLDVFHLVRWLKISAYIGGIVTALFYGAMTLCTFIFTIPGRRQPRFEQQMTHREHLALDILMPQSCVGLAIDLYILILPILGVTRLQMSTRRKVGAVLVFLSAIMACIGSLLSIYYRQKLSQTKDYTWALIPVLTVTLLEMYIGIIVACMPSASRAGRHLLPAYESLKSSFLSSRLFSIIGSKFKRSAQESSKINSAGRMSRKNDGSLIACNKRPYTQLEDYKTHFPGSANSTSTKTMQTFTSGEGQDVVEDGGIHLTYEMQQSDYGPGTDTRSSTWYAAD